MPSRFSNRPTRDDSEETASPELTRLIFVAMGVAMVLGLLAGLVWTGYHLIWLRWFA
jgi:hypothetical protein